jgi:nucleoside-diphosphate-sugar epimerase
MKAADRLKEPVLVTGALGFIGQRLVSRLLAENYKVIAFDLPGQAMPEQWLDDLQQGNIELLVGDICQFDALEKVVSRAKTIFHLAAVVSDWGGDDLHRRVTVGGTERVLRAALEHHCRVILVSSIVVYGDKLGKGVCDESVSPGNTLGPYSRSKQAQERLAREFIQQGLEISIVRPANVYGAGSKPWVEDVCKELKAGHPTLIGNGKMNAGLVHVNNVVELLMLAATAPEAIGETYNIASEETVSWREYMTALAQTINVPGPRSIPRFAAVIAATLFEKIWTLLGKSTRPLLTHEALNLIGSHHQISIDKAKRELGYQELFSYEQGMDEVRQALNIKGRLK